MTDPTTDPGALATGYQLLALALGYPEAEELDGAFAAAAELAPPVAALAAELAPLVDAALPGEYNRLFTQNVAVSPYETDYGASDKGARLGQIASLYQAFGVRVGADEHETVDHIGAQLEFAALLCVKERLCAEAGPDMAEPLAITRRARQIFVEEHLGSWVGAFTTLLAERTEHPYYRRVAPLCAAWIDQDLSAHGWTAHQAPLQTPDARDPAEEDPLTCPVAPATGEHT